MKGKNRVISDKLAFIIYCKVSDELLRENNFIRYLRFL